MPNPAKIFISSAYADDLKPLRQDLKAHLESCGHQPLLFEENFFPWADDFMDTCIQKVKECDIFILLVDNFVGTYWEDGKTTPTYEEFFTAVEEKKYVIAFFHETIKKVYDEHIKAPLHDRYKKYIKKNHREPVYTMDIVEEVIKRDLGKAQKDMLKDKNYHPFIWAFIFDVQKARVWTEDLVISRSPEFYEKINGYFSDHLGQGVKLIPHKESMAVNAGAAKVLQQFQEYTTSLLALIDDGEVIDWEEFLKVVISQLSGGNIYVRPGTRTQKKVNAIGACNAVTVYKQDSGKMKLCGSYGKTTPTKEYDLTDDTSYVVNCYVHNNVETSYSETKQLLYYTIKSREYVLCLHYPLIEKKWTDAQANSYKDEVEYAIMSNNTLLIDFVADLIGGIRS
ncbi:DUF4062 domain-containing protein [Priestia flexa]|uniref:DUF4062 domain-containing protein n=1 Tax=Priestia flexa TaxID=86664 RepID=UPI0020A1DD48|nr:DUF4062 domain-containing protein [Priestia flexa]MCP1191383.1 DUF4062 domain-containing protein [Priestia flexa]